jgi:hypothetical protein
MRLDEASQLWLGPAQAVHRGHIEVPYASLVRYVQEAQSFCRIWDTEKSGTAEPDSRGIYAGATEVHYWQGHVILDSVIIPAARR